MDNVTYLLAAIGSLASGIVFLYLQSLENHKQCTAREALCQEKHEKLLERVVAVETERKVYNDIERRLIAQLRESSK